MSKKLKIPLGSLVILLFLPLVSYGAALDKQVENTQETVTYLIDAVAKSHLTFIRNGDRHSCDEAAAHIAKKYAYFKGQIKTPDDFIRLSASKSLFSGKPYLVETEHGEVATAEWLGQILARYRLDHKPVEHPALLRNTIVTSGESPNG
jgi:hypothetical protein